MFLAPNTYVLYKKCSEAGDMPICMAGAGEQASTSDRVRSRGGPESGAGVGAHTHVTSGKILIPNESIKKEIISI